MAMGSLARTDEYLPDVGDPLVPPGPQVSPGVGWANRLFDRLPTAVMGGLAQMVQTPGALMKANPYPPGSEEAAFYDATKTATAAEWAPGMALNMMGGGVAGTGGGKGTVVGSGPVRQAATDNQSGIKAYHSSPHDFDRFDLSKIGTGEGAQVYGHGLYFAENPAVSGQGGQYYKAFEDRFLRENKNPVEGRAFDYLKHSDYDPKAALKWLDETLTERQARDLHIKDPATHQTLSAARELLASGGKVGPRTYEVNIKADPAQMLDWDKPLREQQQVLDALSGSRRKAVKETLERQDYLAPTRNTYGTDIGPVTGQDFYKALSYNLTGKPGAAQSSGALQAGGIPGIKYLDEGSRNARPVLKTDRAGNVISSEYAPPTSNYVVFDPSIVDIMKKYGIAGAAPAGMGALAAQDYYRNP